MRPDTPPRFEDPLPQIIAQELPSFEYTTSVAVTSVNGELLESPLAARHIEVQEKPATVPSTALVSKSPVISRQLAAPGTNTPSMILPGPLNLITSPETPTLPPTSPGPVLCLPSLVNALSSPPGVNTQSISASSPRATPSPISVNPNSQLPAKSAVREQSSTPKLPSMEHTNRSLSRVETCHSVNGSSQAQMVAKDVFKRDQPAPLRFHVLDADNNGMTVAMIEV
jgi:hypothetical protein